MTMRRAVRLSAVLCAFLTVGVGEARAEIVFLSSGRTLSIKSHHEDGDLLVMTIRTGGESTWAKSLVYRIVPDEVPHPDPEPEQEPAATEPDTAAVQSLL